MISLSALPNATSDSSLGCSKRMETQQQNPSWVFFLLAGKFFVPCLFHEDAKKNEKNVFCLDCCAPICSHCCHHGHRAHRQLQVRRYVYQDVVRLEDFGKLFDCSSIQSYTTNKAKVVFLHQRPHSRPLKCAGSSCSSCERTLQHPYHFCSLGCKAEYLVRYEGWIPVRSLTRSGAFSRPPGSPGPRNGAVEDAVTTRSTVLLDKAACLGATTPGLSSASGEGPTRCDEARCAAATKGLIVTRKKRTRAVAAAAAAAGGAAGTQSSCPSRNKPVLTSFKRKGVPIRSPLY